MTPLGTPWEEKDDAFSERAAEFFIRRRFGEWSEADQAELDEWLTKSCLHRVAYVRVEGIAARTDRLATLRPPKPAMASPDVNRAPAPPKPARPRFVVPLLIAASVALIAAIGIPYLNSLKQPPDRTYSTEVGGRTLLKFADGTVVDLDTDTAVRFHMTDTQRTVWLEKGEAWFHVSHNPANPFSVIVGRHRITDIGTEFLIRRGANRMEVALYNGKASLSTEGAPVAMLAPGDDAVATPVSMSVTRKTPQELADELAWRHGMLVFRNTRLADAVREINRYNTTKLVIADPAVADLTFTGEIKNDNFQDFLDIAESMMKLRADRQGKDILLSREQTKKALRAHNHASAP